MGLEGPHHGKENIAMTDRVARPPAQEPAKLWEVIGTDDGIVISARWPEGHGCQLMRTTSYDSGPARVIDVPRGLEDALAQWLLGKLTSKRLRYDAPAGKVIVDRAELDRLVLAARAIANGDGAPGVLGRLEELDVASEPFSDVMPSGEVPGSGSGK